MLPQLFAIYMDELAACVTSCRARCRLNETVIYHFIYNCDTCLIVSSAIALQKKMFCVVSQSNDIYSILLNLNVWYLCPIYLIYTAQLSLLSVQIRPNIIHYRKKNI